MLSSLERAATMAWWRAVIWATCSGSVIWTLPIHSHLAHLAGGGDVVLIASEIQPDAQEQGGEQRHHHPHWYSPHPSVVHGREQATCRRMLLSSL